MATRRVGWTLRIVSRRAFLEGTALAAAWAGVTSCGAPIGGPAPTAAEAGARTSDAIPAYGPITPNEHHYITSCCGNPSVDIATWTLSIKSRGSEIKAVDFRALRALPARNREHTLECISAGPTYLAISNAIWSGLPLQEVFDTFDITVPAGTVELKFESADGYSTSLPIADLEKPVWLVWRMNGVELPIDHGYPIRLLVPGRYGMKNPKWITSIDLIDTHYVGFWEGRGWSNEAPYLTNTLVHDPLNHGEIPAGEVVVLGTAFAGSDSIASVEVSVDGGDWKPAIIDYAPGVDIWTLWHHDVALSAGPHTLQARCTTHSGSTSSLDPQAKDSLAGFDGSMQVQLNAV